MLQGETGDFRDGSTVRGISLMGRECQREGLRTIWLSTRETVTMSEHKPGSMDIRAQEKTFAGFIKMSVWGAVISILILIVMALSNA